MAGWRSWSAHQIHNLGVSGSSPFPATKINFNMKNIEKRAADTILNEAIPIRVGKKTHYVKMVSTKTLIRISGALPDLVVNNNNDVFPETMRIAKECQFLGDILGMVIVGEKGLFVRTRQKMMAQKCLRELDAKQMYGYYMSIIGIAHISDFFGLTTFLLEVNILRPAQEVVTTVSGD